MKKEFPCEQNNFCGFDSLQNYVDAHWGVLCENDQTKTGCFKLYIETPCDDDSDSITTTVFFICLDVVVTDTKISFLTLNVPFNIKEDDLPQEGRHIPKKEATEDPLEYFDRVQKEHELTYNEMHMFYPAKIVMVGKFEYHNGKVLNTHQNKLTMNHKHDPKPKEKADTEKPQILPFIKKDKDK